MKKQKVSFIVFCLALCVSFGFSSPQEEEYYSRAFLRLNYVKGDVFIQRAEDLGFDEGTVNMPIVVGDKLGTRDGRAEIHFGRKNYLRVDKYTQIDFVKLPQRGDDYVSLHLFSGNVYLRINSLTLEKEFELHSPDGSFYVLEEGLYRFEVRDNRETAIFVAEGSLEAAGEQGSEIIRAGQTLVVANGFFSTQLQYAYAGNGDSFSEWNRGRDVFHNRYVSARHLPVDLYEYEAELADYGRWVYERPYGYVWIPDVYQSSWRPYYHGRWIWYPVCGWTWSSYEPWGWCVSHYGRWHWRGGLGWYWIPSRSWGPAWVHWYHGVDYVGWCPLSYYNRPVVIVNNHFYGRHYDTYYPAHSRSFTVLRRDQLSARRVSSVALDRSAMSRLGKVSLSSKQPNIRSTSSRVNVRSSAATQALSRSNLRPVSKGYSSEASRLSTRTGSAGTKGLSSVQKRVRTTSSVRAPAKSPSPLTKSRTANPSSQLTNNRDLRSSIKAYPSRNSSRSAATNSSSRGSSPRTTTSLRSRMSPSSSRTSTPSSGIKSYPSQRNNSSRSSSSNRSYSSSIKRYSPQTRSTLRSTPSRTSTPNNSSYRSTSGRSSYSSSIKRYSSQTRSSLRSTPSRTSTPSKSSYRSTSGRSSYSSSVKRYSSPSRSTVRSSPSRSRSSSSRVSPSRSSSSSRSFKSTSSSRVSRSSPSRSSSSRSSTRSSSRSRIKKK